MRQWRLKIVYAVGIFGEKPCQGKVGLLQKAIAASFAEARQPPRPAAIGYHSLSNKQASIAELGTILGFR